MAKPKAELWRNAMGDWSWWFSDGTGNVVAESCAVHSSTTLAKRAIRRIGKQMTTAEIVVEDGEAEDG